MAHCLNCGCEFKPPTRDVNRGFGKFCSRMCSGEHKSKTTKPLEPNCVCAWCESPFYRNASSKKNSRSGIMFCSRKCKDEAQQVGGIKEIQPDHYGSGMSHYRKKALSHFPMMCNRCGYNEHPRILVVHHIDRNRDNNRLDNLEVLCPNCHALEHFGG